MGEDLRSPLRNISQPIRLWITAGALLAALLLLHTVSHGEVIVPHEPLHKLPYSFGSWVGKELPLDAQIVQAVSVSDYTNRIYHGPNDAEIQLYIGYYASQRAGDTIHSPKNCLPGAGWDPIQSGYARLSVPGRGDIVINKYVIQQDLQKALVFYWYQSRGRVIASEYAGKFWMVADAISRNRTDGALVRLITPVDGEETKAEGRLLSFAQLLFPSTDQLIPK